LSKVQQMATAHDAAAYILQRNHGPMSAMKLQKLLYYSQAWSLVWDESPLFGERIQAWSNGPVIRDIYDRHRGRFELHDWQWGDPNQLSKSQKDTIEAIVESYGEKNAQWLSDLSHLEKPWIEARKGIPFGERCENEITPASMHEYYSGL
jgi:uncharacterized phage-associated protein